LLDAFHENTQPWLLPKRRFDGVGKRQSLSKLQASAGSLSRNLPDGASPVNVTNRSGLSELCLDDAGSLLARFLGRGDSVATFRVLRWKNSIREAFRIAVTRLPAPSRCKQQHKPDQLWPESLPSGIGCVGCQGQIPTQIPYLRKVPYEPLPDNPEVVISSGRQNKILNEYREKSEDG
jgi:hypothetical protein